MPACPVRRETEPLEMLRKKGHLGLHGEAVNLERRERTMTHRHEEQRLNSSNKLGGQIAPTFSLSVAFLTPH